jgi:Ni,Fe-hydrogenase I cytochrome b subunit
MSELKSYAVWDASTRWFHWINALCVTALAAVGFLILNAGEHSGCPMPAR